MSGRLPGSAAAHERPDGPARPDCHLRDDQRARCRHRCVAPDRRGCSIALLYLDLDHFKKINDTFGHAFGDAVLREFATRLTATIRQTDLAARLGGEEFVVVIEDLDSPDQPEIVACKLIVAMSEEFVSGGVRVCTGVSIGIGVTDAQSEIDVEALMRRADRALYAAKAAGPNTCRTATAG